MFQLFILLLFHLTNAIDRGELREIHGFPCRFGNSMRLPRTLHGLPKRTKSPFTFHVIDKDGSPITYYEAGEKYLIRVTGFVHWRGLILQPRLAHPTGHLIGSLRGGHFQPTRDWQEFGLRMQNCKFTQNDSITHSNGAKKFLLEVFWVADRDVGPVQFMLTLASENDMYWERWRPRNGFLLPAREKGKSEGIDETLFADPSLLQQQIDSRSIHIHESPPVVIEPINQRFERNSSALPEEIPHRKWDLGSMDEMGDEKFNVALSRSENIEEGEKDSHPVTAPAWFQLKAGTPLTDSYLTTTLKNRRRKLYRTTASPSITPTPTTPTPTTPTTANTTSLSQSLRKRQFPPQLELEDADLRFLSANLDARKARTRRESTNNTEYLSIFDCKVVGCENGGRCVQFVNFGRCNCTGTGFTGDRCQEIDYCISQPCQNGICLSEPKTRSFTCQCDDNFVGSKCETKCPENFCKQGGKCVEWASGRLGCECPKGTIGENCEREINECNWLRCVHSTDCIDLLNDYKCVCKDGYMGKNCDRPCQDVYGTCRIWERDGECGRMAETDFFEYNCAVTCKQCVYKNETIQTNRPIPHILLPLTWLLGKWHVRVKGRSDLPFDFKEIGYVETVTFSVAEGLVFGTPAINFTSVAVSLVDPTDQHVSNGFLTIQQYPDDIIVKKAALLTTTNLGYHSIEEGILEIDDNNPHLHKIQFRARYLGLYPEIEEKWPDKMKRTFERKGDKLYQRIAKVRGSKGKKFTKIYTKIENFLF